jgi:outer membrane immunogenic protein
MKKLWKGFAAATAMVCAAGSAVADGMPSYGRAPPRPVYNWTGCYLGLGGGYGMYDLDTHNKSAATGLATNVTLDQGGMGWFGTAQVGCDYQFSGKWLVGAFIDGDLSDITGKHTGEGNNVGLISANMQLSSSWAVGGRLGYLVNPSFLTFASVGYTQARFDGLRYVGFGGGLSGFGVHDQTYDGYFIGGGTEYALGHSGLFWKTEYRFADYGREDLAVFATATGLKTGVLESTHPYVQTVRTELVWRW